MSLRISQSWLAVLLAAAATGGRALAQDDAPPSPFAVRGDLDQRYRYRHSESVSDQDLYGYAHIDGEYSAPADPTGADWPKLGFSIGASYTLDIDSFEGDTPGSSVVPFGGITDTYGDRLLVHLHEAYLEARDFAFVERLRAGRQMVLREESFLFDGGLLKTKRRSRLAFELFGGVPAHLYESSPRGDAIGGASVSYRPARRLELGADYVFLRDEKKDFRDAEDHLYAIHANLRPLDGWTLRGSASWVDSRDRRQLVDLRYVSETLELQAHLRAVRQNAIVGFQSSELSPFLLIEGDYAPYYQVELDLYQPLGEKLAAGGGLSVRELERSADEGEFNHSFRNAYVSVDVEELWSGMRGSLRGDLWESDGDDIYTAGVELQQEIGEFARLRLGTSYSLYRFDDVAGVERERNRRYYVKVRWHLLSHLDVDTEYRYEKDSETEYHTVIGGFRTWF